MIDPGHELSIAEQCRLLKVPRSSYYYERCGDSEENLDLMEHVGSPTPGRNLWLSVESLRS